MNSTSRFNILKYSSATISRIFRLFAAIVLSVALTPVWAALVAQTITFGTAPTLTVGEIKTISATATSGLAVSFTSLTYSTCSVSGNAISARGGGTCTIAANQYGDYYNYLAAPQILQNIVINKATRTITFGAAPTLTVGGSYGSVSASLSAGYSPSTTFSSTTPSVCSSYVGGGTFVGIAAGTCTIAANNAGDSDYLAAQATQSFTVGKGDQTINYFYTSSLSVGRSRVLSASATSSNAVSFSSTTPSVCTVSGATVTGITAGTCTVAANQTGDSNYLAAPQVTSSFVIDKGSQSITFGEIPSISVGTSKLIPVTANSGLVVSFVSTSTTVCSVTGNTISGIAAGTCFITATQPGDANYTAATDYKYITIVNAKPTITFGSVQTLYVGGSPATLSASSSSGLAVTFQSTTPDICTVSGSVVLGVAVGACIISAAQAGNGDYPAADPVSQSISVLKGAPALTLSTTSITFDNQRIGIASASKVLSVKNTGTSTLTISSVLKTTLFGGSTSCLGTLAVGASCTVSVSYTPIVGGTKVGLISITSDAPSSPDKVTLTGVGVIFQPMSLDVGWNLVGQSITQAINVQTVFNDPAIIATVWKWNRTTASWQFYTPSLTSESLQSYATSKGYEVLTQISGGEGYWVNAKVKITFADQTGTPFHFAGNDLLTGWNLISTGDSVTPSAFNGLLSSSPPEAGTIPLNFATLWAWDSTQGNWYFYAPSLEKSGELSTYLASRRYLDSVTKVLDPGMGFWVNKP